MIKNITNMTNAALVDELGMIKAERAELAQREKSIRALLMSRSGLKSGQSIKGHLFNLNYSETRSERLDAAAVRVLLKEPPVTISYSTRWDVRAKKQVAA